MRFAAANCPVTSCDLPGKFATALRSELPATTETGMPPSLEGRSRYQERAKHIRAPHSDPALEPSGGATGGRQLAFSDPLGHALSETARDERNGLVLCWSGAVNA